MLLEPHQARLAVGDGAREGDRPALRLGREREQRGEGARVGGLALDDRDAAGLGQRARVDEVDPLLGVVLQEAAQRRPPRATRRRAPRARPRSRG